RGSDGNTIGIDVGDDAIVDAGSDAGLSDPDPTGLGRSTGLNDLSGYTGVPGGTNPDGSYAIRDLNLDSAGNINVYARNNIFGTTLPSAIELVVFHTVDDPQYTQVFFTPANNPQPAPTVVYVNHSWAGTGFGTDTDGAGGGALGNGTAFGY